MLYPQVDIKLNDKKKKNLLSSFIILEKKIRMNTINMDKYENDLKNLTFSSSHWRCSMKRDVFKNFTKFIGKHLSRSLIFDKAL